MYQIQVELGGEKKNTNIFFVCVLNVHVQFIEKNKVKIYSMFVMRNRNVCYKYKMQTAKRFQSIL